MEGIANEAELDAISLAMKWLFIPLPSTISEMWERSCDLTLVARSIMPKSKLKHVFGPGLSGHALLTDALRVYRLTPGVSLADLDVNSLYMPSRGNQKGFGSMVVGFDSTLSKRVYIYNEYKIAFETGSVLEVVANKLVHLLEYHFSSVVATNSDPNDKNEPQEELKRVYFNLYIYNADVNVKSVSKQALRDHLNSRRAGVINRNMELSTSNSRRLLRNIDRAIGFADHAHQCA